MVKNIYKNKQQKEELKCMKRIHSHENVTQEFGAMKMGLKDSESRKWIQSIQSQED